MGPAGPDPSEEVLTRLRRRSGEVALPSVARHELTYGAERMDDTVVDGWMMDVDAPIWQVAFMKWRPPMPPVLPYDTTAAQWHG